MKTTIIFFACIAMAIATQAQYVIKLDASPTITVQPQQYKVLRVGEPLELAITASGVTSYQWQKNGIAIARATSATYKVPSVSVNDGGVYHCIARNGSCQVYSNTALVIVKSSAEKKVNYLLNH